MKLDNLKEENLIEIIRIYGEHCGYGDGFREVMYQNPGTVLENLKKNLKRGYEEYSIHSRWDIRSKLFFAIDRESNLSVSFNPNIHPDDLGEDTFEEAINAGEKFVEAAMKYLNSCL
jgi:hypothetical protein